jgi:hypothetical protein
MADADLDTENNEPVNIDNVPNLPFEIHTDQLDLSLSQVNKDYPPKCLPSTLTRSSSTKAKPLSYELIDRKKYEKGAHMVTFHIRRERL